MNEMRCALGIVLAVVHIPFLVTESAFVNYKMTNHTNTKFTSNIRELGTSSLTECAVTCEQTNGCVAISFKKNGRCKLSNYKPDDTHAKTMRKDGWNIYMKHGASSFTIGFLKMHNQDNAKLKVYVVTSHPTKVTLTAPLTDYRHEVMVNDGTEIILPDFLKSSTGTGLFPSGISVVSNTHVDIYVESVACISSDGSFVIPTDHLADEYVLLSHHEGFYKPEFAVIGTVDGTDVNIIFKNGTKKNLRVNRNQMYHHQDRHDISGTLIWSSENIAVFAGHECSRVESRYCDYLYEQMPPIRDLHKEFIASYPYPRYDYVLSIIAVEDNTEISLSNGRSAVTLNRLDKRKYMFSGIPMAIIASKQIIVAAISIGRTSEKREYLDGSMLILPGLSQFKSKYIIFVPGDVYQCIMMITFPLYETSITRIRLNQKKLVANENASVTMTGRGQYTILYKELSKGTSVIYTTDGTPFGAYVTFIRDSAESWFSLS